MNKTPLVRPATEVDIPAINSIFNFYVANSSCVWITTPWSDADRFAWFKNRNDKMPVFAAELDGRVIGWASLSTFRDAYTVAGTLEDSIYIHHDFHHQGIGSLLLSELIASARKHGLRSILANISADQIPSIRLHEKFGFKKAAHLHQVGSKFGQLFDAVFYQLLLS